MNELYNEIMAKPEVDLNGIQELVDLKLKKYEGLSPLEQYGLYMGMAQILEMQIKQILISKFNKDMEKLEKATLGRTVGMLKDNNVRPDLISLLENNCENRNHMAHAFLADTYISLEAGFSLDSIIVRQLSKYIVELENTMLFWEWCLIHDSLLPVPGQNNSTN